ncbi:MAG: type I CRISPR-associated protein Cas7, partial [Candidatus Gracilibacteria bacterium]|nr:type I CRISPR-associated protein Cas7 [Candidatus Gracilibacteria bacterium]
GISEEDVTILKEGFKKGATLYDSTSKAGTENELLLWIQLKEDSKLVLPNFSQLVKCKSEKQDGKVVFDFATISEIIATYKSDIEKVEVYANTFTTIIENFDGEIQSIL